MNDLFHQLSSSMVSLEGYAAILSKEAIRHIYCPRCSRGIQKNEECMAEEKGWVIEYDPNLLRPAFATVRLIQHRRKIGSTQRPRS